MANMKVEQCVDKALERKRPEETLVMKWPLMAKILRCVLPGKERPGPNVRRGGMGNSAASPRQQFAIRDPEKEEIWSARPHDAHDKRVIINGQKETL